MANTMSWDGDDFQKFSQHFQSVSVLGYRQEQSSENLIRIFSQIHSKMSFEQYLAAMDAHSLERVACQYLPQSGQLVAHVERMFGSEQENSWQRVMNAMRLIGKNRSVSFNDPKIHMALQRMGGWIRLCETCSNENMVRFQKLFYDAYSNMNDVSNAPKYLIGLSEAVNNSSGLHKKPQVYVIPDMSHQAPMPLLANYTQE